MACCRDARCLWERAHPARVLQVTEVIKADDPFVNKSGGARSNKHREEHVLLPADHLEKGEKCVEYLLRFGRQGEL
eukprot:6201869-Pleurochrysis_carterae.AAC.1